MMERSQKLHLIAKAFTSSGLDPAMERWTEKWPLISASLSSDDEACTQGPAKRSTGKQAAGEGWQVPAAVDLLGLQAPLALGPSSTSPAPLNGLTAWSPAGSPGNTGPRIEPSSPTCAILLVTLDNPPRILPSTFSIHCVWLNDSDGSTAPSTPRSSSCAIEELDAQFPQASHQASQPSLWPAFDLLDAHPCDHDDPLVARWTSSESAAADEVTQALLLEASQLAAPLATSAQALTEEGLAANSLSADSSSQSLQSAGTGFDIVVVVANEPTPTDENKQAPKAKASFWHAPEPKGRPPRCPTSRPPRQPALSDVDREFNTLFGSMQIDPDLNLLPEWAQPGKAPCDGKAQRQSSGTQGSTLPLSVLLQRRASCGGARFEAHMPSPGLSHSAIPPAPTPSIPTPPTQARTTTTPVTITYNPNDVSDDGGFYGLFSGEIDPELNLLPQSHCALQPTANQCAASPANKVQPSAGKRALAPHSAHRAPALRTPSTSGSKGSSWDADARECEEDNCGFCELFDFGSIDLEDNFLPESLQERLRWSMESKAASAKRGTIIRPSTIPRASAGTAHRPTSMQASTPTRSVKKTGRKGLITSTATSLPRKAVGHAKAPAMREGDNDCELCSLFDFSLLDPELDLLPQSVMRGCLSD